MKIKVAINQDVTEVDVAADETVLSVLRRHGLTGTKEGCASGDCGACTVMVGKGEGGYETINACIAPMSQMAGRQLLTVEGLADPVSGELHPSQAAMVQCHGSQCGYCTPGFVMSLASLVENGIGTDEDPREAVLEGISGNLCRCTGYRPIVEAGQLAVQTGPAHTLTGDGVTAFLDEDVQSRFSPTTTAELQTLLKEHPEATLIAGGTDLMLEVTQRFARFPTLIDLTRVEALNRIETADGVVTVGSAVPYTHLETYFSDKSAPMLDLLSRLGSRQIRNRGTVGGNLGNGSPIADMPPALIAWDADVLIESAAGTRSVSVEDFYEGYRQTVLGPGEYIAAVSFPAANVEGFHRFYKSSKRIEDDISSVMGAFAFDAREGTEGEISRARIAYGGMAATPVRLAEVETLLVGEALSPALLDRCEDAIRDAMTPLTDVRASADYRMDMAVQMFKRAVAAFQGDEKLLVTELEVGA